MRLCRKEPPAPAPPARQLELGDARRIARGTLRIWTLKRPESFYIPDNRYRVHAESEASARSIGVDSMTIYIDPSTAIDTSKPLHVVVWQEP